MVQNAMEKMLNIEILNDLQYKAALFINYDSREITEKIMDRYDVVYIIDTKIKSAYYEHSIKTKIYKTKKDFVLNLTQFDKKPNIVFVKEAEYSSLLDKIPHEALNTKAYIILEYSIEYLKRFINNKRYLIKNSLSKKFKKVRFVDIALDGGVFYAIYEI